MGEEEDRRQIAALTAQIAALTAIVAQQATSLALLADGMRPTATITIAALYSEFEKTRGGDYSWRWLRNRLLPLVRRIGNRRAMELTPLLWAEHRSARASEKATKLGAGPSDSTLNMELTRAKEMLDFGVTSKLLEHNPLKAAKAVKTVSGRETWLGEAEVHRLLGGSHAVSGQRPKVIIRAFILCALDAMMRFNEVRKLRWDRIAADGVIELSARQTKSRRRRVVALTPRALEAIREIPPVLGNPYVFANPDTGKLYGEITIRKWFRTACIASGVDAFAAEGERVVPHSLRHSGASLADARGASALSIKEALGHASLATSERYLHRHRETGARDLAALMAAGAESERRGPQRMTPTDKAPFEKIKGG
jgi:integrase